MAFLTLAIAACSGPKTAAETAEVKHIDEIKDLSHLEELFWARLDSSRMSFVQADVDFMTDMIVHHAQAVIMSRLAPDNNASRAVQTLAARIINAQEGEIATMQKWLRDRGQAVPVIHIDGLILSVEMVDEPKDHAAGHHQAGHSQTEHNDRGHGMTDRHDSDHHSMAHHHDMPGMLTQSQLDQLAGLQGRPFDRTFLTFMIEHHEGAVIMVNELFAAHGAANDEESYRMAVDIYAEQITEIEMMKLMLQGMEDTPAPTE